MVVHGHRDSRYGSLYRAEMLRPYVAWVVVFDLPGHGEAAARSCKMSAREAEDVCAVVDGLPEEMTTDRPLVLLGYSMGAVVVVRAAEREASKLQRPEDIDGKRRGMRQLAGVIACAPYRYWDQGLRGQMQRRRLPQWPTVWLVGAALRIARGWDQCRAAGRNGGWGEPPGLDVAARSQRVEVPLLVLHGDADRVCPLSAGRVVAEAAPLGRLVVIPGGTHNQLLTLGYDRVHAALAEFFGQWGDTDQPVARRNVAKPLG